MKLFPGIAKVVMVLGLLALVIIGSNYFIFVYGPPPMSQRCQRVHVQVLKEPEHVLSQTGTGSGAAGTGTDLSAPAGAAVKLFSPEDLSKRAGFGLTEAENEARWAARLGAGWFIDWAVQFKPQMQSPEHWQTVRLFPGGCIYPSLAAIRWAVFHNRGQVWIIGNEPDNIWQDDVTPEIYAKVYHDLYAVIKMTDPNASVAVGGISQATPLRLAYLDRVLAAYHNIYGEALPADWWTVHGYVLREERHSWGVDIPPGFSENQGMLYSRTDHGRIDLFKAQIITFREWMATNGYREKPLALTEFGILLDADAGYTPEMAARYLRQSVPWLETATDAETGYPADGNRLVQRWAWFSLADRYYPTSSLADSEADTLTIVGQAYREYVLSTME